MRHMPLTDLDQCWMEDLTGLFGRQDEWCAAGAIGGDVTVLGACRPPKNGESMVVRFMEGETRGSGIYVVQQLASNLYRCLRSGDLIEWADEQVKVYSALSRIIGGLRMDLSTNEVGVSSDGA